MVPGSLHACSYMYVSAYASACILICMDACLYSDCMGRLVYGCGFTSSPICSAMDNPIEPY